MQRLSLLSRSLTPLAAGSAALMVISGGILALAGYLGAVWIGFLLLMVGPFVFPFVLFPAGVMAGLWQALQHRKSVAARLLAAGSVAYIAAVVSATLWLIAAQVSNIPTDAGVSLFWGEMFLFSAAIGPWAVFALYDRGNKLFVILLWMFLAAYLLLLPLRLMGWCGPAAFSAGVWLLLLLFLLIENWRERRVASASDSTTPP